jgi:hypothetical protein
VFVGVGTAQSTKGFVHDDAPQNQNPNPLCENALEDAVGLGLPGVSRRSLLAIY